MRLCQSLANIPWEVQEWARRLRPQDFSVSEQDLNELRKLIADTGAFPSPCGNHLRTDPGHGLQVSQFRFTKCLKLYMRIEEMEMDRRGAKYFEDNKEAWDLLKKDFEAFCRKSAQGLSLALKYTQDGETRRPMPT